MLLMNPHPHYIRLNPFEDPAIVRGLASALQRKGGAASGECGDRLFGFHSFTLRDTLLERLRERFGATSVEAEDGPYYVRRPVGRTVPI